jgi:hypothetical protein
LKQTPFSDKIKNANYEEKEGMDVDKSAMRKNLIKTFIKHVIHTRCNDNT